MPLHDASYQHWPGHHLGIWYRRASIARQGLHACLENRWTRHLLFVCWSAALVQAAVLFALGQLLVADSLIVQWVGNLDQNLQTFARLLTQWLEQHPEISVRTSENILFYYVARCQLPLALAVVAQAIPQLLTRDLASHAITIYASKAIGRVDYVLGKFGAIFSLLVLAWLGPIVAAWFLGNLLAPDWRFFWHARLALANTLLYGLSATFLLSVLALGVSALSHQENTTVGIWVAWWVVGYVLTGIAEQTKPWLKHLSFQHSLGELELGIFHIYDDILLARENIPVLGDLLRNVQPETLEAFRDPAVFGASAALAGLAVLAVFIVARRIKPQ